MLSTPLTVFCGSWSRESIYHLPARTSLLEKAKRHKENPVALRLSWATAAGIEARDNLRFNGTIDGDDSSTL